MKTNQQNFNPNNPGLVAVIIYNGLCTFEFGLAVEIFGLERPEFDFPWYDFKVVSSEAKTVRATGGIKVEADGNLEILRQAKTIIIPGWRDKTERPPETLLTSLRQAHDRGARFVTICSGVFVLAASGLLDGKTATTHWQHIPQLKNYYPELSVEEDVLYVDEGNIITSAGSAAGIDACLHLIRRDYGSKVANSVARRLVLPSHREGGQAQYNPSPVACENTNAVSSAMEWAQAHLDKKIEIPEMAAIVNMSERTFLRKFKNSEGVTPMLWLQKQRMSAARELLESTDIALPDIAEKSGYQSMETFRVTFKRVVGVPPASYRKRFRGKTISP